MNTIAKNTTIAMVSLTLFYFIFLESNSFYLSSMSSFSLEPDFVTTIVPIMGLNALGFLCFPLYSLKLSRKNDGARLLFSPSFGLQASSLRQRPPRPSRLSGLATFRFSLWAYSAATPISVRR